MTFGSVAVAAAAAILTVVVVANALVLKATATYLQQT